MHIDTQISSLFDLKRGPRNPDGWDRFATIWDWGPLGFPGVYSAIFFLTVRGRRRYLDRRALAFPQECCRCSAPADVTVDFHPFLRVPFLRIQSSDVHLREIPHCREHSRHHPFAFGRVLNEDQPFVSVQLFALHRPFLEHCIALNRQDGELPAPWVAFPRANPYTGFKQGINESWMRDAWTPFWSSLSSKERDEYLARYKASPEWRERLGCGADL